MNKFKQTESYLHAHAKRVLTDWIINYPEKFNITSEILRIVDEEKCVLEGKIMFVPDISVYTESGLSYFFEVVHTSDLTGHKLNNVMYYCFMSKINPIMISIDATYIMTKVSCPKKKNYTKYELFNDELF